MNAKQISAATTAELLAAYNVAAADLGLPAVKRFANRATAERRAAEILVKLAADKAEQAPTKVANVEVPAAPAKKAAKNAVAVIEAAPVAAAPTKTELKRLAKEEAAALVAKRLSNHHCVFCGVEGDQTGNGPEDTYKGDNELFCHHCSRAYDASTGAERSAMGFGGMSAKRSEAIAESWKNPATAALRAARLHIEVDGVSYKSVPEAFRILRLPMEKHIAFRGQLRENKKMVFKHRGQNYTFVLVEAK